VFLYVCVDQGRWLEDRNRLDTGLVPAVNDADCLWLLWLWMREISEYVGIGDSIFARMKLEEIDGGAPPGVECAV